MELMEINVGDNSSGGSWSEKLSAADNANVEAEIIVTICVEEGKGAVDLQMLCSWLDTMLTGIEQQ